ncbi:serine/threonine protein kinase [Sphaerospermopsis aphanizomenoides BCCUSP55]|uniref:serine/threonine-protein kinase n=1 Tax=Sphaerospermopsis aphanizomenoides TaxID=459663 RepID=UPI0019064A33|nr:serine/threonine-protein kinase [Sphaerospermopsis aphanizomenoides]MBK1987224.1 serine/threonine protein kinase [Sphaerospermopsis aphanizomenoides BCCUSP55]
MQIYCSQKHANTKNNRFCTLCGEDLLLTVGQVIDNRYEIGRILGQGGFGRSYLAVDRQKAREKCVLKEFAPQVVKGEDLQKAKELFEREASVLKKILHPQIPRFHASIQAKIGTRDFFFLVQDYIPGENYYELLAQRRSQGKSFSEQEVVNLLHHLLPVLSYIHKLNIIHRDISPDNLILRHGDNLPVLIDFGGVKQLPASQGFWQTQLAGNGTLLGKKGYAPEEQLIQGKVYKNSDLYSLAVTVLVLVTGKEPQTLYDSYNGAWYWGKEIKISSQLEVVLKKMLAYKPSDRYQTAEQVIKDLPAPSSVSTDNTILTVNTMQPTSNKSNSYLTKLKTMVAAPGIKHARNLGTGFHNKTKSVVQQIPMPAWLRPFAVSFILTTGVTLTGAGLWTLGNFMVKSISSITLPKVEIPPVPTINNPGGVTSSKRSIQEVFSRLQELEISSVFFTRTVNEIFYTQKPDLRGRELTDNPEDRSLREQWNNIADELLKKIEQANLSATARRKIGTYSQQDSQRWDRLAKAGRLGKYRSFQDLRTDTYQKFDPLFPGQEHGKLNQQTFLQIWYAIASDQVGNR